MTDYDPLRARRLANWRQTPETRLPDPDAAALFIESAGIATLFPASSEIPDLFHAYVGDPEAPTESSWDSPSGHVYGWRWALDRRGVGFYTALVRKRPTWISWPLLPAILRLCGELRAPEEIYRAGELSANAYRIAQTLEAAGGVLSTGELRRRAGFPTGKEHRAAYLKAVEELDTRLMLAKVFSTEDEDDLDMRHALVAFCYPDQPLLAEQMTLETAMERFLQTYLPFAVYAVPPLLAKHMGLPETELRAGLERLQEEGRVTPASLPVHNKPCYVWHEG
jgi:hypothetical protein